MGPSDGVGRSDQFVSNGILKAILEGLYDEDCHLSRLRGCYHVLQFIWRDVRSSWHSQICLPRVHDETMFFSATITHLDCDLDQEGIKRYLMFPEPSDINIKMMPFLGKLL